MCFYIQSKPRKAKMSHELIAGAVGYEASASNHIFGMNGQLISISQATKAHEDNRKAKGKKVSHPKLKEILYVAMLYVIVVHLCLSAALKCWIGCRLRRSRGWDARCKCSRSSFFLNIAPYVSIIRILPRIPPTRRLPAKTPSLLVSVSTSRLGFFNSSLMISGLVKWYPWTAFSFSNHFYLHHVVVIRSIPHALYNPPLRYRTLPSSQRPTHPWVQGFPLRFGWWYSVMYQTTNEPDYCAFLKPGET